MGCMIMCLTACNDEDDVLAIFNDTTWKMTRLNNEGNNDQFLLGIWQNGSTIDNDAYKASMENLKKEDCFLVRFINFSDTNDIISGTMEVTGIKAKFTTKVRIDASSRTITMDRANVSGSETDKLAARFISGMSKVNSYTGDTHSLTLYYQDGQATMLIGFTPQ